VSQCQNIVSVVTDLLSCSAYKLLRHPGVTTSCLSHVIPELASIDPVVLTRVQIEGISYYISNYVLLLILARRSI
jgi:hypothetical protein